MKIRGLNGQAELVGSLSPGQVFIHKGSIYIMTDWNDGGRCAVRLDDGALFNNFTDWEEEVMVVAAEVHIGD